MVHLDTWIVHRVCVFVDFGLEMEASSGISPRKENRDEADRENSELESLDRSVRSDHQFRSTSALEILRETVRILRYNLTGFMGIAALLICPVSAVFLSNVFVDQSIVKRLSIRLLLIARSTGVPFRPFAEHLCHKLSETAISSAVCFPLYITLSLLAKAAVVYSVDCTYSRMKFDSSKFYAVATKIWRRPVLTYLWVCMVISGCLILVLVILVAVGSLFAMIGVENNLIVYPQIIVGFIFSVMFANAIVICNLAIIISVLENVSGFGALLRSTMLIRGQVQVGLSIFLGSTIAMAFVEGLFESRVKTVSYGDGSSRIWEGPLLVLMHSFVVLVDGMMSTVFYFSCKSHSMEASDGECELVLHSTATSHESTDIE